ncbi:MAG: LamG domain-containing protein [bacterium]
MKIKINIFVISFFIFIFIFMTHAMAKIDPETIAGMWLFDEGSGKTAKDSSGNKFDGDLNGDATWTDGKYGMAIKFNGADYVQIRKSETGLPFGGTEPFSITAWVNNNGGGTIIGKFNGGIIGAYIVTISGGGTVTFHREVAPWGLGGTKALPAGEFGHVAVTYDGAEMKIYINGKLDVKQDRGAQNTDLATPVLIGARYTQGKPSEFFRGILDEVIIFKVALTEEQIQEVMKGMSPTKAVLSTGKAVFTWGNIKSKLSI